MYSWATAAGTTRVVRVAGPRAMVGRTHGNDDRQPAPCPRRRPGLAPWSDPARPLGREPARECRDVAAGRIRRLRPFDEPAGDRGRRRRTDGRAPSGRSRAGDVRERIGARGADRRDRGPGTRLPPVHRASRRATWLGPVDHVGSWRADPEPSWTVSGRRSPTGPRPSAPTSAGSARRWSRHVPAGPRTGPSSRSASRGAPATRSMARSPRSLGHATTAGSIRPSPTRGSPPTSRRGGPTRPMARRSSTGHSR